MRPGLHGAEFTRALHQVLPALGAYVLSFVILGQLWLAHHRIFGVIARVDYTLLVRNLLFLGLIAIMPREPVPEEVRDGFARVLLGMLVVFGAAVPVGMFAPQVRHPGVGGDHPPRVARWWWRDGVTDDTDHRLYDCLRRCQDRASRDATSGMHGGDGGIPRNRQRWVLPAALVVVGVLMMVIGSALFGPLYRAQRMLERGSPSEFPGSWL